MWNNASVQKCKAVYDVLAKISKHAGVVLPDGKSADDLLRTTADEILNFGQRVFDDNELWSKIPTEFICLNNTPANREDLREYLKRLLDTSK